MTDDEIKAQIDIILQPIPITELPLTIFID